MVARARSTRQGSQLLCAGLNRESAIGAVARRDFRFRRNLGAAAIRPGELELVAAFDCSAALKEVILKGFSILLGIEDLQQ